MFLSNSKFYVKSTITSVQAAASTFLISEDFETGVNIETGGEIVSLVLKTATQIERFTVTATGGVATIVERGLTQADTKVEDSGIQKTWTDGTIGYIAALASDLMDIDGDNVFTGANTFEGVATFEEAIITEKGVASTVYASTAARDAALGADGAATLAYTGIQAAGVFYNYNLSTAQWESVDTGTATPNASPTVTGSTRLADSAQSIAGTDTESGDPLVVIPSDIAKNTQSGTFISGTAAAADTKTMTLTPTLTAYGNGLYVVTNTTVNTGAVTLNIDTLGAKAVIALDGGALVAGDMANTTTYILYYDGTSFILVNQVKATETRTGSVEILTDAEYGAGIDTTRLATVAQMRQTAILQTTRTLAAASSTVNIAHGLSVIPKNITITAKIFPSIGDPGALFYGSDGYSDGTSHKCTKTYTTTGSPPDAAIENSATACVEIELAASTATGTGEITQSATASFDATNVDLVWTLADNTTGTAPTGTIYITIKAEV